MAIFKNVDLLNPTITIAITHHLLVNQICGYSVHQVIQLKYLHFLNIGRYLETKPQVMGVASTIHLWSDFLMTSQLFLGRQ